MRMGIIRIRNLKLTAVVCASLSLHTVQVIAADGGGVNVDDEGVIEEVVVTGTRGKPRSVMDSAVPVDVLSSEDISSVSYSDTHDILQTLVPSYNVGRQPISDGATFIRPATLRGLPSDKTLVLVNSKRRHRASLVTIGGSGTQGPDVATIPSSAIRSIEVLRDGAAAQYGSDAIAGVINFILKDASSGVSFSADAGEFYDGDGASRTFQGNIGLPLGEGGFLNISGEYMDADYTERDEQYCESWFCLNPNSPRYDPDADYNDYLNDPTFLAGVSSASLEGDVVQPWGQPNADAVRFFYNAGYDLFDGAAELYSFGNYSNSNGDGGFFYRYPGNGTIEDLRVQDGSIYSPLEIYPGGFTPRFEAEIDDYSFVGGLRGEIGADAGYDISYRYGSNEVSYTLKNTINPSLGPDTPTSFKPGDLSNEESQFQLDLYRNFELGLFSPVLVAGGFSYMDETYEVKQGQELSYLPGPYAGSDPWGFCNDDGTSTTAGDNVIANGSTLNCADPDDPVYQLVGVGSNGFPGYAPDFSETYDRDSYAVYLDVSTDITEKVFVQGAVRYEDYSDFGTETVWKMAGRYALTDNFAFRASVGTGFRAPTPGQQGTTNVSTRLPNGFPVATGLFPAGGDVAQALGANELDSESSDNYTFGLTATIGELDVSLDYYRIDISDRLYAVSTLDVSSDPTSGGAYDNFLALVDAGVAGAESIGGVFYFQNAFDSKTQGVDLVATYPLLWSGGAITTLTSSVNYNKSELDSDASEFLNQEDQDDFENRDPEWRAVVSALHQVGPFSILGRARYFGSSQDADSSPADSLQHFEAMTFFDLEGAYQINENFRVTVGGRNILDQHPEQVDRSVNGNDYCCGRVYQSTSIVDWQGGYYYLRLNADF